MIVFPHIIGPNGPDDFYHTMAEYNKAYDPSGTFKPHMSWVEVENMISRGWRITQMVTQNVATVILILEHADDE
jgi:hypothetical protein